MKQLLLFLLLFTGFISQAQQPGMANREKKIEALYVAYITKELNLNEEEAKKFWPIHTSYDQEVRAVRNESNEIERQQAVLNIKKKYQDRFVTVLGQERTNNFFIKDAEFRKKLVDQLRKMRQQNQQNKQAPGVRPGMQQNNF
ncbi:MAG: hypothetical protein WEA59_05625 [Ferruginibacter sp.]